MRTKIIYEDKDILVCHKPSGIAVQSAGIGSMDMVSELKNYLNLSEQNPSKTSKNKEPYLGIVHRLDQPVEGVIVFAKTPKAAASLSQQAEGTTIPSLEISESFNENLAEDSVEKTKKNLIPGGMKKIYQAEVYGHLIEQSGELRDYLIKDGKTNTSKVIEESDKKNSRKDFDRKANDKKESYKLAVLQYEVTERRKDTDIIRIQLYTGRHHQIRVQFSHAGYPLVGDAKYASKASAAYNRENNIREIALKAVQLEFTHPSSGEKMVFSI